MSSLIYYMSHIFVIASSGISVEPLQTAGLAEGSRSGHNDHMAGNVVGARELKVRLGRYLRRVRQGHHLVVTDRGQPVAELRPIGGAAGVDSALAELEAKGVLTRPSRKALTPFRLIERRGGELATAVVEDRDDRF